MVLASDAAITFVPRFWRMYLALWLISRCRLPATPALIRPLAVSLKRFLAPDLVFNFGILHRTLADPSSRKWQNEPPWHAMGQAVRRAGASKGKGPATQGRRPLHRYETQKRQ